MWVCVYENEGIQLLNGLWRCMCDETNGSWICFFFSGCSGSQLSLLCVCFISLWVCEFILFEGISLHDPLLLYGVCLCLYVSEPAKHVPVCFSLLLKGYLDFGFIYLKNLFLSFSLLTIIYCVFFSLLSARTLIKHTLSALKTLNSIVYYPMIVAPPSLLLRLVSAIV